jgi:hypothetical protein
MSVGSASRSSAMATVWIILDQEAGCGQALPVSGQLPASRLARAGPPIADRMARRLRAFSDLFSGPLPWASSLGLCCGPLLWASALGLCCGPLLWASAVGLCCGPLLWASSPGLVSGPLSCASFLVLCSRPLSNLPRWVPSSGPFGGRSGAVALAAASRFLPISAANARVLALRSVASVRHFGWSLRLIFLQNRCHFRVAGTSS